MTPLADPLTRGTLYCVCASIAYTAYNLCLRGVSDKQDSSWVTCVQASVGMAVFGAYLAWQSARGRRALPPWKDFCWLVVIGMVTQVGGALMVWGMGVVGVATTATLEMGVMLAASAILGLIVLGERVAWQQVVAIVMITAAVVSFSYGAQSAPTNAKDRTASKATSPSSDAPATTAVPSPATNAGVIKASLGVAAGVLAGLAFAVLVVGVRKTVTQATSPEAVVFLISAMGVVFLGPWCAFRLGVDTMLQTPLRHLAVMLLAGLMNLVGFLLITKGLQLVPVVRVNVINNASTMTLTAVAGILCFAEPWNRYVMLGILLTIIGGLLISLGKPVDTKTAVAP